MERVDTEGLREWAEASTAGFVRVTVRNLADKLDEAYAEIDRPITGPPFTPPRKMTVHALLNSEVVIDG